MCTLLHETLGTESDLLTGRLEECRENEQLEAMLLRTAKMISKVRGDKEAETFREPWRLRRSERRP